MYVNCCGCFTKGLRVWPLTNCGWRSRQKCEARGMMDMVSLEDSLDSSSALHLQSSHGSQQP